MSGTMYRLDRMQTAADLYTYTHTHTLLYVLESRHCVCGDVPHVCTRKHDGALLTA